MRRNPKLKKASAGTLTKENKQHSKSYLKTVPLSNLKEQIGELSLLLLAGNDQSERWQLLDQLLRQFYEGVSVL